MEEQAVPRGLQEEVAALWSTDQAAALETLERYRRRVLYLGKARLSVQSTRNYLLAHELYLPKGALEPGFQYLSALDTAVDFLAQDPFDRGTLDDAAQVYHRARRRKDECLSKLRDVFAGADSEARNAPE